MLQFARTAADIAGTTSTLEKRRRLAAYFRSLPESELRRAAVFLTGQPYGRAERRTLNLGWATVGRVVEALSGRTSQELGGIYRQHGDVGDWAAAALEGRLDTEDLPLTEITTQLDAIGAAGSTAERDRLLASLLGRLSTDEVRYLVKVLTGEMRIGLQEGLVEAALADAFEVPLDGVRRVHMVTGDIGETAVQARRGDLETARLTAFHARLPGGNPRRGVRPDGHRSTVDGGEVRRRPLPAASCRGPCRTLLARSEGDDPDLPGAD
jgi:DNA ligase 1